MNQYALATINRRLCPLHQLPRVISGLQSVPHTQHSYLYGNRDWHIDFVEMPQEPVVTREPQLPLIPEAWLRFPCDVCMALPGLFALVGMALEGEAKFVAEVSFGGAMMG